MDKKSKQVKRIDWEVKRYSSDKRFSETNQNDGKKKESEHRRAIRCTGGGLPPPSPHKEDLTVMDLCPTDFIDERNQFDCDGTLQNAVQKENQQNEKKKVKKNNHKMKVYPDKSKHCKNE
ncbi:Uncharacterized protein OBRU01_22016 [Operophtera brumata]|uniref:Uncharacterized protein n=1 Tax=Operophtera brumata TaxID=104452 RepID=A0A0L7KNT1_OPEBR|nr:Uncharacterized protein OBRU01_22016 [Operophtera brumata]